MHFYAGSVVRVDLTLGRAEIEPLRPDWMQIYVGGKGLLLRYLYEELVPGTDPLAPENPLMIFTGPFAGTTAPTCSRIVVGCRSPLTGAVLDSYAGGSFGPELKFAGYDGIVITGRSSEAVVLSIEDGCVQLLPAEKYRGLHTSAIESALRRDLDPQVKVLSTGPAGESGLPWACLSTDQYHKAGRGGAGAVMGSKNLKAIAVRGRGRVQIPDARGFLADTRRLQSEHLFTDDNMWAYEEGTPALVEPVHGAGALPIRNFTDGALHDVEGVSSAALLAKRVKNRACSQCGLACRQFHRFGQVSSEGPEFETIALCGTNCGIVDLDALSQFNWSCDELGMDTMSTGSVVALAMDLHRRGIADLGLRFGDVTSYLAAPGSICEKRGAGAEMALGARTLAERYGHPELAAHVKGMELPGYDPRGSYGMGLAYATSDRGACHMRAYPATDEILVGSRPADTLDGKAELVVRLQDFCSVSWTGIWCSNWATTADILVSQFSHLWQRATDEAELMRVGARIWNLARLINVREGFDSSSDRLPGRILSDAHPTGAAAGRVIGEAAFDSALSEYYAIRGWTPNGVPRNETLAMLGVDVRLPEPSGDGGALGVAAR